MPLHQDFQKVRKDMIDKHGKEKGEEIFYKWINKNKYDETKPMDKQADVNDLEEDLKQFESSKLIAFPAFKIPYVATEKSSNEPLNIKAVVLEQGKNLNNWEVPDEEFAKVAKQYKEGRHLRLNHGKDVQDIIGKSYDGKVLKGSDLPTYFGNNIEGLKDDGKYVVAEFKASPMDPQVRANILNGYVDTGSPGFDAEAHCAECDKPLDMIGDAMFRSCDHSSASVVLRNVQAMEYSYVSEPAYQHTMMFPSFAAAVSSYKIQNSSLTTQSVEEKIELPDPVVTQATPTTTIPVSVPEAKEEMISRAVHEEILKAYRAGREDAKKDFEAVKTEAPAVVTPPAEVKTDQIAKTVADTPAVPQDTLMDRIRNPTAYAFNNSKDPLMSILFKAAAEGPTAPADIRATYKRALQGRFD